VEELLNQQEEELKKYEDFLQEEKDVYQGLISKYKENIDVVKKVKHKLSKNPFFYEN
jgi:hypothetical protein